jgi:acyl-coenzyme A thioesterase PaaI-like protein
MVGHHADDAMLDELTNTLLDYSQRIRCGEPQSREKTGFHEHWDPEVPDGGEVNSWIYRPVTGAGSPWSLEPEVRRQGDGVVAKVTFHQAHEGAPERCHGGLVAALFDDILGCVLHVIGEGAFTGELTIRYDAPVPLHRELLCNCRLDRKEGRKLYMTGELTDGDTLVSSARALFIQPRVAMTQSTFDPA